MKRAGKKPRIGWLDESAFVHDPARRRVLNTREIVYTLSSEKRCVKIFGFTGIGCKDVIQASYSCKKEYMTGFLQKIREKNPKKPIGIVLDNARIHTAEVVREAALKAKLYLIPMPAYSPDPNPIEHLWKDTKRETAKYKHFDDVIPKIPNIALKIVKERKLSYSNKWRLKFIADTS